MIAKITDAYRYLTFNRAAITLTDHNRDIYNTVAKYGRRFYARGVFRDYKMEIEEHLAKAHQLLMSGYTRDALHWVAGAANSLIVAKSAAYRLYLEEDRSRLPEFDENSPARFTYWLLYFQGDPPQTSRSNVSDTAIEEITERTTLKHYPCLEAIVASVEGNGRKDYRCQTEPKVPNSAVSMDGVHRFCSAPSALNVMTDRVLADAYDHGAFVSKDRAKLFTKEELLRCAVELGAARTLEYQGFDRETAQHFAALRVAQYSDRALRGTVRWFIRRYEAEWVDGPSGNRRRLNRRLKFE